MKTFFTADAHFGHGNIAAYCSRPFIKKGDLLEPYSGSGRPKWEEGGAQRTAERMNTAILREINMMCGPEDTLVHVGDFCVRGRANGVDGMKVNADYWESQINCKVVHILGNHDRNNGVKGFTPKAMLVKLGPWQAWVQHLPPWDEGAVEGPECVDLHICGHVHTSWKYTVYQGLLVVNVGLDVWGLRPVEANALTGNIHQYINSNEELKNAYRSRD